MEADQPRKEDLIEVSVWSLAGKGEMQRGVGEELSVRHMAAVVGTEACRPVGTEASWDARLPLAAAHRRAPSRPSACEATSAPLPPSPPPPPSSMSRRRGGQRPGAPLGAASARVGGGRA